MHPIVPKIAVGAALWFLIMTWLDFARGGEIDYLFTASYSLHDSRWPLRDTSLREFLRSKIGTATGTMRGRDALIETALVPVSLAIAATVIGLVWSSIQ
jgi:hypothetical protein